MTTAARAAAVLVSLLASAAVLAGSPRDDFWSPPDGAVAWWFFDPTVVGPNESTDPARALAEAGLRSLLTRVILAENAPPVSPADLLLPGVLESAPYRLCLLQLQSDAAPGRPTPDRAAPLSHLWAVLEIDRPAGHEAVIALLRSRLNHAAEKASDFPGGLKGTTVGDGTREVAWCSTPRALLIGFGHRAIEQWLASKDLAQNSEAAGALDQIERLRSGKPVLEAFVDVNAFRAAVPEQFAYGRIGRLVHAWQIANARSLVLSARLLPPAASRPPLLALDLAVSSRAKPVGDIHPVPLTEGAWPPDLGDIAPAPYAAVFHADWGAWINLSLETWVACSPKGGAEAHAATLRWMQKYHQGLDRILSRGGAWCIVRGGTEGLMLDAQLFPVPRRDRVDAIFHDVMASISDHMTFDQARRLWTLSIPDQYADPDHLLSRFYWGTSRDGLHLIGGWREDPVAAQTDPTK